MASIRDLGGRRKAAMLMVALGPEVAAEVFGALGDREIAELSAEVAEIGEVSTEERQAIIAEFHRLAETRRMTAIGGASYAHAALARSFGPERATEILGRIRSGEVPPPSFRELENLDASSLRDLLRDENPQTIAVVLAHLSSEHAAHVIAAMDSDARAVVLTRLAQLGQVQRELVDEIHSTLTERVAERPPVGPEVDGPRVTARILNATDKELEEEVLGKIEGDDPTLAAAIQRQMFLFEDLLLLDGRSVQKVLRGVDAKVLSVAMKAATQEMQEKILSNMSRRAADVLRSELEVLGPLPVAEVERAQQEIIEVARGLEKEGQIVVPRGGAGQLV